MITVAIIGAAGKMGSSIHSAVKNTTDIEIARQIHDDGTFETDLLLDQNDALVHVTPRNSGGTTDVAVEFTVAGASFTNVKTLLQNGMRKILVGTSGWSETDIERLQELVAQKYADTRILIVPNFSISAVLQEMWSLQAAKYFNDVSIIEYHHKAKLDKPSGTALRLQDQLEAKTGTRPEALSIRADGYLATQEVIMTGFGERLKISQDVTSREAFMPGVLLAIRALDSVEFPVGVSVGLQTVLQGGGLPTT